ncbi:MAG: hypothetical protein JEZ08_02630 [Clostridiales bacterium]|nr:hypothetical protein [Clostridiales bacterium]
MKKYIGIAIFITLQVITIFSFTNLLGLASILGIWAIIYLYVLSSMVFNTTLHVGGNDAIHKGDFDTVTGDMKASEVHLNTKDPHYSLKYINIKWFYLGLFVTNAIVCFILIKG